MKPLIKAFLLCLSCVTIIFSIATPISAADEPETINSVSYDMSVGGTQIFHLTDKNGNESVITVTEVKTADRVANGVYQIDYTYTGFWTAGYKIVVTGNRIVSAYDKYITPNVGSITDDILKIDNAKQASYRFQHSLLFTSFSTGVRCILDGDKITISSL